MPEPRPLTGPERQQNIVAAYIATEDEQRLVDEWPSVCDEIRSSGDGGLFRVRVTAPHPPQRPCDLGAKLADVIRENWQVAEVLLASGKISVNSVRAALGLPALELEWAAVSEQADGGGDTR